MAAIAPHGGGADDDGCERDGRKRKAPVADEALKKKRERNNKASDKFRKGQKATIAEQAATIGRLTHENTRLQGEIGALQSQVPQLMQAAAKEFSSRLTDLTAENARMMLQMQVVQRDYEALQGQLQAAREQNDHLLELTHRQTAEIAQLRTQSSSLADDLFDDDSDGASVQHGVDNADDFAALLANVPGALQNDVTGAEAVNMQLVDDHSGESK
ncbi:hypothetical protein AAVH_12120 [Aphelenchoides avenae]|nr:hypothetical protein AAVH_12120 [Aphelenchus avenae]